jgi:hypothetical protein
LLGIEENMDLEEHSIQDYQSFLWHIANKVYNIVHNPENRVRFEYSLKDFCEINEEYELELMEFEKAANAAPELHDFDKWGKRIDSETDEELIIPPLTFKMTTPPNGYEGYVWYKTFWGPPTKRADLIGYLQSPYLRDYPFRSYWHQKSATKADENEKLLCSYALLTSIHDMIVTEKPIYSKEIYSGSWSLRDTWIKSLWDDYTNHGEYEWAIDAHIATEDLKAWIERALYDVDIDLGITEKVQFYKNAERLGQLLDEQNISITDYYEELKIWLNEFRNYFFEFTVVEAQGKLPYIFEPDEGLDLKQDIGQLTIFYYRKTSTCRFKAQGGKEISWKNPVANLEQFERLLFGTWCIDDGKSLESYEDSNAVWCLNDPNEADSLDELASRVETLLLPLFKDNNYKPIATRAIHVIRNGQPRWRPGRVQWSYIKDLDSVIKELDIATKMKLVVSEQSKETKKGDKPSKQDIKSGINPLIETIHNAQQTVEKLAESELDLNNLSQTEMAYADAEVIKYLTNRFGEQDDALGNWPRDWHECPEAFDLWKQKIKEYRAAHARASLEEVKRLAEVQGVDGPAQQNELRQEENTNIEWIRGCEAAEIAGCTPGTISRWANGGKIKCMGGKGPDRRIDKTSLLLYLEEKKKMERQKGFRDYNNLLNDIPNKH